MSTRKSTHKKPELRQTKDYDLFEMHPMNRDLSAKPHLRASMQKVGFMPSGALHCVRLGGKLRVIRGHNRFALAKELNLPVWYIVDESNTDIGQLEGDASQRWSILDHVVSRAKAGDVNYKKVLAFKEAHQLSLGSALMLCGTDGAVRLRAGFAADSNQTQKAKDGLFRFDDELTVANRVVGITDHLRAAGCSFATQSALVGALARIMRVPECDPAVLKARYSVNPTLLQRRTDVVGYMETLDILYNYGAKAKRLDLRFRAEAIEREAKAKAKAKAKPKQAAPKHAPIQLTA